MNYELSMFLSPKMTDEDAKKKTKELDQILEKFEAKVLESNFLGMKDLAYQIKHFKQGYYFIAKIEADPSKIKQIKYRVYDDLDAIRMLVTKQEKDIKLEVEKKADDADKQPIKIGESEKKDENKELRTCLPVGKVENKEEPKKEEEKPAFTKTSTSIHTSMNKEETDLDKKLDKILEEDIVD